MQPHEAQQSDISPMQVLADGLRALDESDIVSIKHRNHLRQQLLKKQVQRVVDMRRERLWVCFRIVERRYRQTFMVALLEKYSTWFLESDEDLERDIVGAVLRIQSIFRGGMARIAMSSKLVAWGNRAKRGSTSEEEMTAVLLEPTPEKSAVEMAKDDALYRANSKKPSFAKVSRRLSEFIFSKSEATRTDTTGTSKHRRKQKGRLS